MDHLPNSGNLISLVRKVKGSLSSVIHITVYFMNTVLKPVKHMKGLTLFEIKSFGHSIFIAETFNDSEITSNRIFENFPYVQQYKFLLTKTGRGRGSYA